MCTNCDGRIPFDAEVCPYCAADLSKASPQAGNAKELHHQSLQDSLTSLYTPPYAGKNTNLMNAFSKPQPLKEPMAENRLSPSHVALGSPTIPMDSTPQQADEGRSSFWPILLLSMGANLLTVGLLQLFFSDNGFLRLEWNSSYWFAYCLGSVPLFLYGFKKINQTAR